MLSKRDRVLLIAPFALVLLPFLLLPACLGLLSSFTDYGPVQPHIHVVGLSNYVSVFQDSQLRAAFRNSALLVVIAVPVELLAGFAIAYALREPFRGRGIVRVLLVIPWSVSPIAAGVMWHFLYNAAVGLPNVVLGWVGVPPQPSPLGLRPLALPAVMAVEVWRKAPLASFLLLPGLVAIPADLWEQATLDGASLLTRIRHVAVPAIFPLLLTVSMFLIGDALGMFETVLMMTGGGPGSLTLTPSLYSYQQAFGVNNWPAGIATAWVVAASVLLVGSAYVWVVRGSLGQDTQDVAAPTPGPERQGMRGVWAWSRAGVVGVSGLAIVLPLLWAVLASFEVVPDAAARPPGWAWPPSGEQYGVLMSQFRAFAAALRTSLALSAVATLLTVAIAFLAAYALSRSRARSMPVLVQSFLVLAVLPPMAYVIPLSDLLRHLRLHDTFAGVALASCAVYAPLAVFVLYGYVSRIPAALDEMARLEGASALGVLWHCVAPLALPGLAAVAVLVFVLNWNLFLVPLTIALPHIRTVTVTLSDVFLFERDLEWTTAAAALVLSLLPAVILVAAAHRVLERFGLAPPREVRPSL